MRREPEPLLICQQCGASVSGFECHPVEIAYICYKALRSYRGYLREENTRMLRVADGHMPTFLRHCTSERMTSIIIPAHRETKKRRNKFWLSNGI